MSKHRKSRLISAETKLAAITFAALVANVIWFVLIGRLSDVYRACVAAHRIRARDLICSPSLLTGGAPDYLIFVTQWLPFGVVAGSIWLSLRRGRIRVIRPSSKIQSE